MMLRQVYFMKPIGQDGPVKIGCSKHPGKRLADIATWSPIPLEILAMVPGTCADEQFLHGVFFSDHLHREWFRPSATLSAVIEKAKRTQTLSWARDELSPTGSHRAKRPAPAYLHGYRSYRGRVRWALDRLQTAHGYCEMPDDVRAVFDAWFGDTAKHIAGRQPTAAEIARLDSFLADPAATAVFHKFTPFKARAA